MERKNSVVNQLIDVNDTVLSVEDVAKMLRISSWGVRKRILRGQLPAHRQGRRLYILKSELVASIRS